MAEKRNMDSLFEEVASWMDGVAKSAESWSPIGFVEMLMDKTFYESVTDGVWVVKLFLPEFDKDEISVKWDKKFGTVIISGVSDGVKSVEYVLMPIDYGVVPVSVSAEFVDTVLTVSAISVPDETIDVTVM